MAKEPEVERGDYEYKKKKALEKISGVFEECLDKFHGDENDRIREDIANYTIGYLGISFGLHVKRVE